MPNARLLLVLREKKARELHTPLVKLGYQVLDGVVNNEQALEKIDDIRPNLVFVSIQEDQDLGGVQFGQQIYSQYDIPVIYITDQSSQSTIRRSGGTAPFGYLFSPVDEKEIMAAIEVALTRHSMERQLRESKQWLNTIVDSMSEGLIAIDLDERIRLINPIAEELTGKKGDEYIDWPLSDFLYLVYANSDERVTFSHALAYLQKQDFRTGFEALLLRDDGTKIPVEVFVSSLNNKNIQVGMVLTFRDISERKRSLEEIRKHAMQSEAMFKAAKNLNSRLDVKAVLNTVCEVSNNTLGTVATSAFLYDPSQESFVSMAIVVNNEMSAYTFDAQTFAYQFEIPGDLILNTLSQSESVIAIRDVQALDNVSIPYLEKIIEMDVHSLAIAGMYQNNALTGILVAQMHGSIREFSTEELDLLRGLASQASIAVGNATLFEQVIASRERQQALTRRLVELQEIERRSLARELHDQIGQMLTVLQFSLASLQVQTSDGHKNEVVNAQNIVRDLIAQTREISMNLRPSMLDDTGLVLTLIWYFDQYTAQTGIKVGLRHHNILEKRFVSEIEIAVFRIIQEALTNVARHAKTDSVSVGLKFEDQKIKIDIVDEGQGFDPDYVDNTAHMGLSSMHERAYAVGGLLEITSVPGRGTRIHAIVPLSGTVERRQNDRQGIAG